MRHTSGKRTSRTSQFTRSDNGSAKASEGTDHGQPGATTLDKPGGAAARDSLAQRHASGRSNPSLESRSVRRLAQSTKSARYRTCRPPARYRHVGVRSHSRVSRLCGWCRPFLTGPRIALSHENNADQKWYHVGVGAQRSGQPPLEQPLRLRPTRVRDLAVADELLGGESR